MRVLLIADGVVRNWVEAQSVAAVQAKLPDMLCVADPLNGPNIGWLYDGSTFSPPPANVPAPVRVIPLAMFLRRIPKAKRISMWAARTGDADLNDALTLFLTYADVRLDDQDTRDFVTFLRVNGHINAQDALDMLT